MTSSTSDFVWVEPGYELDDFLSNPRIELPQYIKLGSKITASGDYDSLDAGQILLVHEKRTVAKLAAKDGKGRDITIPVDCPHKVKLELGYDKSFNTVLELAAADPLPKFVEVTKVSEFDSVKCGDTLKVVIVEKGGGGPAFVHFRSAAGKHVKIGVNTSISFKLTVNDVGEQSLSDIVSKSRELPILISFVKTTALDKAYNDLGTVQLNRGYTEDYALASYKKGKELLVLIFKIMPNMKFQIPQNYQSKDDAYRNLCHAHSEIDLDDIHVFLNMLPPSDHHSHYVLKYDKFKKLVDSGLESETEYHKQLSNDKVTGSDAELSLKQDEQQKELVRQKQKEVEKLAKAEKERQKAERKKEKKAKRDQEKIEREKEVEDKKKKLVISNPVPADSEDDTYIQPQSPNTQSEKSKSNRVETLPQGSEWSTRLMKKVKKVRDRSKSLGFRPKKRGKLPKDEHHIVSEAEGSCDYTGLSEDGCSESLYETLPCDMMYESLDLVAQAKRLAVPSVSESNGDSGFDELDSASLKAWRESMVPPPLPGNHPPSKRVASPSAAPAVSGASSMYEEAVDSASACQPGSDSVWRAFYEMVERSTLQISGWDMEDVSNCLRDLKLESHIKMFANSQVDGKLLLDLDESVLVDLGLSVFEGRKLRKFVFGWRPDFMRPDDYPALQGFDSLNPADWSEDDVVAHLHVLETKELADFCKRNQVNGDLLKDICVDETVMNSILTSRDRKLKIVKIKNYVIEKWRPKKAGEGNYSSFERTFKSQSNNRDTESKAACSSPGESPKCASPTMKSSTIDRSHMGKSGGKAARDSPLVAKMKQQLEEKADWEARKKKTASVS